MGNFRYNTGYRKYGQETLPTVFGPVPGHTYPGSRTVFSFSRKNENERFKTGIWYRTGRYFSCSFSSLRTPHGWIPIGRPQCMPWLVLGSLQPYMHATPQKGMERILFAVRGRVPLPPLAAAGQGAERNQQNRKVWETVEQRTGKIRNLECSRKRASTYILSFFHIIFSPMLG